MTTFPQDRGGWVQELKGRARILEVAQRYTKLRQAGGSWRGPCPIHGGKGPNFAVTPDRNLFKCFVCGESGDTFTLVQKVEELDFLGAAKLMAGWFGVEVTERRAPRPVNADERTRQATQTARLLDPAVTQWATLGLATVQVARGLGAESGPDTLLTVPVGGTADTPLGWRRYRLNRLADGSPYPVASDVDPLSAEAFADALFISERIRGDRNRDDVVLVDEPLTALRLIALGYRAVVAPAAGLAPRGPEGAWLTRAQAEQLRAAGVRRLTCFVSIGGPESAARQRALHATEVILLEQGIEWCVVLPLLIEWRDAAHPVHDSSWAWWDALGGTAEAFRAVLRDNARVLDVFQRRVTHLAARVHAPQQPLSIDVARDKVLPSLRAAYESGDPVLYHAYVAWAIRAFRVKDRGFLAKVVHAPARAEDSEEF